MFRRPMAPRSDGRSDERALTTASIARLAFAVRTGDNHNVALGVAEPDLPVPRRRVEVRFLDNLRLQPTRSLDCRVKIVDLEPQHDAVSVRRGVCVDEIGMVFRVPGVELKKQPTRAPDPIVHFAVRVIGKRVCSEQFGVPSTARANIAHRYERLSLDHGFLHGRTHEALPRTRRSIWGVLEMDVDTNDIESTIARPQRVVISRRGRPP